MTASHVLEEIRIQNTPLPSKIWWANAEVPVKTEEQKKMLQAKVADKNGGEKCVVGWRIYLIEQGIEKWCLILQKGKKSVGESSESWFFHEQKYRNKLITVFLLLS